MAAVEVTRTELSAAALRRQAARSRDAEAARRMLAIALVLDGHSRADAAEACGMDRQTLRDWVHRYDAEGTGGLMNRRAPGPAPRLSAEQEGEPARWGEDGPELAGARWRRALALPGPAGEGRAHIQAASPSTNARSASCWRSFAFGDHRCGRSTRGAIPRRSRRSGGLRRAGEGCRGWTRPGRHARRGLVRR